MRAKIRINIIVNWCFFKKSGMSGGDRIFMELARRWRKKGCAIRIFTNECGLRMCQKNSLVGVRFVLWPSEKFDRLGLYLAGIFRTWVAIKNVLFSEKKIEGSKAKTYVYSSSDFWPDAIPAFLMKKKNPDSKWIAGFFLFAPPPWRKNSPYKGIFWFKGLIYWFFQQPIYWLVKKEADVILVTSQPDVARFSREGEKNESVVVVQGGTDVGPAGKYLKSNRSELIKKKRYDGCFVGRFHYQKGVLELIEIWRLVCQKKPLARLVLIGDGPLRREVEEKIKHFNLSDRIKMFGFRDGEEKYQIFKESKVIVHPAIYDSGGMAAAEAMAWGLPGVSFDLEALRSYYPKGMVKVPEGDREAFAGAVLKLLEDRKFYSRMSKEAIDLVHSVWNWDRRADILYRKIFK